MGHCFIGVHRKDATSTQIWHREVGSEKWSVCRNLEPSEPEANHMPWCDTKHEEELSCAGHLSVKGADGP